MPFGTALVLAIFWGFIYYFFNILHGMPKMFDRLFPFFFASLFGVHSEIMSVFSGMMFAMLDAAVFGFVLGWLIIHILFKK